MKSGNLFYLLLIIFPLICGCGREEKSNIIESSIKMRILTDSTGVELYHVPEHIMEEFRRDSLDEEQWQDFFAVYKDTADGELRDLQPPLSGSYKTFEDRVLFKPDTAFRKGIPYFARCYIKQLLQDPQDIISKRKLFSSGDFLEYRFRIEN